MRIKNSAILLILLLATALLAALVLRPGLDLSVSRLFYRTGEGFYLKDEPVFEALRLFAYAGSRLLGLALAVFALLAFVQKRPLLCLSGRAWFFLLIGLLLGPGLVANVIFKDHWGRARPREVVEFGGGAHFSPAGVISDQCRDNCSFVAGDAAFGFYLPAFAYVVPLPFARRSFWSGMAAGALLGLGRLMAGAHFLSDVLFAALFMQAVLALLFVLMFGRQELHRRLRNFAFVS